MKTLKYIVLVLTAVFLLCCCTKENSQNRKNAIIRMNLLYHFTQYYTDASGDSSLILDTIVGPMTEIEFYFSPEGRLAKRHDFSIGGDTNCIAIYNYDEYGRYDNIYVKRAVLGITLTYYFSYPSPNKYIAEGYDSTGKCSLLTCNLDESSHPLTLKEQSYLPDGSLSPEYSIAYYEWENGDLIKQTYVEFLSDGTTKTINVSYEFGDQPNFNNFGEWHYLQSLTLNTHNVIVESHPKTICNTSYEMDNGRYTKVTENYADSKIYDDKGGSYTIFEKKEYYIVYE